MATSNGKKLCKTLSGLRMIPSAEAYSCPFALEEPMWMPDGETSVCVSCEKRFDVLNRRHHCRRCGKCFCNRCCSHKMMLQRMYFVDPVRHCYDCAIISKQESEFYGKGLAVLLAGEVFEVEYESTISEFACKLTTDTRYIVFASTHGSPISQKIPGSILLTKIVTAKILTTNMNDQEIATGATIIYKAENGHPNQSIDLHSIQKRNSSAWVICFQTAMKLLFESRG